MRLAMTALILWLGGTATKTNAGEAPTTLLELFTSQGCSSCPPADALLDKFAKQQNILALSMPVNYWDHLGWKDTLATDLFTNRQRAYADARGDREIYTPQIIVNGLTHVVGSREEDIVEAMERTDRVLKPVRIAMKIINIGGDLLISADAAPEIAKYRSGTVWLVLYSQAVKVDIRRGENNGRKVIYTNVVRHLVPAGRWEGEAMNYRLNYPSHLDVDGGAAFLQAEPSNAILGIAVLPARRAPPEGFRQEPPPPALSHRQGTIEAVK
jgi:hypothetical protein